MFDLGIESKWHPTSLPISVRIDNWIHKLTARGFWPSFSSACGRILNKQSFHGKVDVIHHCHPKKYPHQEGVMCHQSLKGLVPGNGFLPSKKQIAGRTEISGDQPGRESFPHSSSHCHDRIGQNSQSRNNWRKQKCPILDMFLFRIPI